jgi:Fic family protein
MRKAGSYQKLGDLEHFIPLALPPVNPPLNLDGELMAEYSKAIFVLGQLNQIGHTIPDAKRFMRAYVIKEALLSSAIEGVHTTLLEVFTSPLEGSVISKDTQLVLNYTKALDVALHLMQDDGLPLTNRVILEAHAALLSDGEGSKADPGYFRRQGVRVGELVPPPAFEISNLMSDLEKYINEHNDMPALIKAGLVHVQFETIHPFLDGNGRIGRLLIVLMLIQDGLLAAPILYPSYFFKKHRLAYYHALDRVRTHGDFEGWIKYYLQAIYESAQDAQKRAQALIGLEAELKMQIKTLDAFSRIQENALSLLSALFTSPINTITKLSKDTGRSYNTIQQLLHLFMDHGWVVEVTKFKRNRLFHFKIYLDLLEKEF